MSKKTSLRITIYAVFKASHFRLPRPKKWMAWVSRNSTVWFMKACSLLPFYSTSLLNNV